MSELFDTVLVANRGEIACRVIRTLRRLGIRSVAIYSMPDAGARHVREADLALCVGQAAAAESYLSIPAVLAACREAGADAVHPGYGFLSENAQFARALAAAGIAFLGPSATALEIMGDKIRAKNHVGAAGVRVVPGISEPGLSDAELIAAAESVGYPLLIKPSAGGGGKGMHGVYTPAELPGALATARRVAGASFGDDTLFLERLVARPRHIEVQILGDASGQVVHLGERECSLQRRHQKVIEESPSPLLEGLPHGAQMRERIGAAACAAAASVNYTGAGTVEFLVSDTNPDEFFFMEMNTRLQVEHPVTEMVARVGGAAPDLVEWQLRVAAGEPLNFTQSDVTLDGHAVEARVYAENPAAGFLPAAGTVVRLDESVATRPGLRVDSSLMQELRVCTDYDPMLAKVIAWGPDRGQALSRLDAALADYLVLGVPTNLEYLRLLLADPQVRAGRLDTNLIERKLPELAFRRISAQDYAAAALSVIEPAPEPSLRPWQRRDGWRLGDPAPWRVQCSAPGPAGVVTVSGRRADRGTVAPAVVHVSGLPDGERHVSVRPGDYQLARSDDIVYVGSGGWAAEIHLLDRAAATARMLAGLTRDPSRIDPVLRSPMPGTVTAVSVGAGAEVAKGEMLLAVEAMKMEHLIVAPMDGTVQLHVGVGDVVKAHQPLATVRPQDQPDESNGKEGA